MARCLVATLGLLLLIAVTSAQSTAKPIQCQSAADCAKTPNRPYCLTRTKKGVKSGVCSECRTSKDCPAGMPVCSSGGKCMPCVVPESAKCSMATSRRAFGICNRIVTKLGKFAKGNCLSQFAKELLNKENAKFFRSCTCRCANRDVEGKFVDGTNQEACHLRFLVARMRNLSGYPVCPKDMDVGCDMSGVCAPVYDGGISYTNVEINACGPNGTPYPKPPNNGGGGGDDDDDDDDDMMF